MKEFAKAFYTSQAWKDCRAAYRKSVGGLCERCLKSGLYNAGEIVHHKIPLTDNNINDLNISLSWNNLQALCRQCHAEAHDKRSKDRRYTIDADGKIFLK